MKSGNIFKTVFCPLLAAIIWGAAFAFQRKSAQYLGAFTFNAARSLLAFFVLGIYVFFRRKKEPPLPTERTQRNRVFLGGIVCGSLLFAAANLQQAGIEGTEAGKAGFITALYIVLVPLFSVLLGKKVAGRLWLSIIVALVGLFLLCVSGGFTIAQSDLLVLLCAVVYGWYIIAVDFYVRGNNAFMLSCLQFLVCGVLSLVGMFLFEHPVLTNVQVCVIDILYMGIMSSAVAYTLQAIAQKAAGDAPMVTLLLSMESVFSVLFGALMLRELLTGRELLGCGVMFAAVLLAEFSGKKKKE